MVETVDGYLTPFLVNFPGLLCVRDKNKRIVFLNESLEQWVHQYTNDCLLGMTYEELMTRNVIPNCSIKNVYHHNLMVDQNVRSSSSVIECCLDETIKYFDVVEFETRVNNDTFHYMIAKDITDLYCEKELYLKTSLVDELSGLYNKRFLKSYHFTNNSLIIMIDLDNFKLVNDHYGHVKGDELIQRFSALLRSVFRSDDCVVRYGGDEFIIITESNFISIVNRRMSHIKQCIAKEFDELSFVTFSYGADFYKDDFIQTMNNIDKKMYENKNSKIKV
ncbi:GGDEF domain-containing protein [Photobacterium leiognathi]|uniref:GGDEF domain-containing protein n=1 Tax=Photobacterium leiognathi TaxID=553611 RepID=UPI00273677F8|nr:GGDEF domain-containing protein [Photobacterium leiognathi]